MRSCSYITRNFSTAQPKMFDKILIANRGEIACRVIRSARAMGVKTVAIYSEPDRRSLHVEMADEAICVGPSASADSYLRMDRILEAVKSTGAQGVHPGYGFLSENTDFSAALEEAGVAFIGPGPRAIQAMGDKIESKKIATDAGVNVIPGFIGEVHSEEEAIKISNDIGYPVMLKAAAGGGGKGMRVAWNDEEAIDGFRASKAEALSSFGDDRMLIEKFVDKPRHVEVQVLCDGQGTSLYLNERECSIQRRNQKVLEEAPSPFIDPETRAAMGKQACQLADAVDYKSAGTVEFLVDSQKNFYFLEMNTRLQVEHPITEYITGVDIVEQMLRIASGFKLDMKQSDIGIKGWAHEARVYAEDPYKNFMPSIGRLTRYRNPSSGGDNVRVDTGVQEGSDISMFYDPLISKLCTFGKTRDEARLEMKRALDEYVIRGVGNNVPFLRSVMDNPKFISGDITTNFIPEEFPDGFKGHQFNDAETTQLVNAAAAMHLSRVRRDASVGTMPPDELKLHIVVGDNEHQVDVAYDGEGAATVNGQSFSFDWDLHEPVFRADMEGQEVIIQSVDKVAHGYLLQHCGSQVNVGVYSPKENAVRSLMPEKQALDTSSMLISPMPGTMRRVSVKAGDKVFAGQELVVLEAMKMQNVLRAERDGVVKTVNFEEGQEVAVDDIMIEFEQTE